MNIVDYSNFENFHGPLAADAIARLPERLRDHGCDAVIVGIGACGGCTPAVMRVAAMIEKLGIPTVSVVTTGFLKQAELVAGGWDCRSRSANTPAIRRSTASRN